MAQSAAGATALFPPGSSDAGGVTANRLTGFDLVVAANGTLRLGVNQAPDYPNPPGNIGPSSSTGRVT